MFSDHTNIYFLKRAWILMIRIVSVLLQLSIWHFSNVISGFPTRENLKKKYVIPCIKIPAMSKPSMYHSTERVGLIKYARSVGLAMHVCIIYMYKSVNSSGHRIGSKDPSTDLRYSSHSEEERNMNSSSTIYLCSTTKFQIVAWLHLNLTRIT